MPNLSKSADQRLLKADPMSKTRRVRSKKNDVLAKGSFRGSKKVQRLSAGAAANCIGALA